MELTTTQLAERTGVPAGTLRMWEARHAFPRPTRLPGGHRRYGDADVDAVRAVVRHREDGLSLPAAILRATVRRRSGTTSIFAGVRERRPDLQPMVLSKQALLALTRAIEDEYCARASSGVLIGSFQSARFYRQSRRRWRELARTARIAVALAEFDALRQPPGEPYEVPIRPDHPLAREWALVFNAREASVCLAGWEVPDERTSGDSRRRFEVVWSPEPEVVHAAIAVVVELIAQIAPALACTLEATLEEPAEPTTPQLRAATALAHRMLAYLGARLDSHP